jgi:type VI secretion system secreted protein Hcp
MALNAYLTLKGQTSGDVKGSVTQKGHEDNIMIVAWSHAVSSPRDAASGLPTGKRMHKPMKIVKEIDKSTPILYNMLCNNENITNWELTCWRPGKTGSEIMFYTIKLTNASIANMHSYSLNNKDPNLMKFPELEEVEFCYQKIEWIWPDGGISALDDWESPLI